MKTALYYFTGTGNSLSIARKLAEQTRGDHRLEQRSALVHDTNGLEQLGARRPLQQIALGPGLKGAQDTLVGVKSGEDDDSTV